MGNVVPLRPGMRLEEGMETTLFCVLGLAILLFAGMGNCRLCHRPLLSAARRRSYPGRPAPSAGTTQAKARATAKKGLPLEQNRKAMQRQGAQRLLV